MRVKRESRRLSAVVKKEDEDTLAVGLTPMIDEPALPDTKPVNGLGGLNDRKPAANQRRRVRLFADAVVIIKRNPEARFDLRYKRMSSLVKPTEPRPRSPTAVKKKSPSPAPPTVRTRRGKKISKQQRTEIQLPHVKLETQEGMQLGPVPASPISFAEELIQSPPATPQDYATLGAAENGVKVREESPDIVLDSPVPPATLSFQQADEEAMKKWKNPKAKVKKEEATLTGDSIKARLTEAGISMDLVPIDCDKDVLDTMVSRVFMSKEWGGSSQETFPTISPKN
ncbi:hypothetical protein FA13DRAFT_684700 [Coprinellus micaceus]|uniref:Uncharacterized protein n=1 Tax=Coprinellus micaceus TaxID=71717 RepID=A0A4Y7T482_COPMI|nr:hypothetical protein FA13DRAFT_684700 [Coprinellus micaceus]